ncbi:MAG: hypothetical protein WCH34_16980 [Bacteroidota bacterium]
MNEDFIDIVGQVLWVVMFITPLLTIPFAWRYFKVGKALRIVIGLILAASLSFFLYFICLAILFRNGLGPG